MHCPQVCSMVCLSKKQLFLVVLAATCFACFLSIRHFEVDALWISKAAHTVKAYSHDGRQDSGLFYDSLQSDELLESEGGSRNISHFLRTIRNAFQLNRCVPQEELRLKFLRCYQASEKQDPKCKAVHANPDSYWRTQPSRKTRTHDEDFQRMTLASTCCAFDYPSLTTYSPRNPPFQWEVDYLCGTPHLSKMEDTAFASRSSIRLLSQKMETSGGRGGGEGEFLIGDQIQAEVVVRNGRNEIRRLGGDSVLVWLSSPELGAAVAADVIDMRNGSYLAKSILPWSGKVKRYFSTSHWFTALYEKGAYSEATPCSPYPALPGFSADEICNITKKNGGFPWYCGKPAKKGLSCSDYISARKIDYPSFYPLTAAEQSLIDITESQRPFLIPSDITVEVKARPQTTETTLPLPSLPCNQRDMTQTFRETDQSGYLYRNVWRPLECHLPNVNSGFLQQCLKNTQFLFLGDSNTRLQMDILTPLIKCTNKIARARGNWHAPLWCDRDDLNISIKYFPPNHPFYGSVGEHVKPEVLSSAVEKMDSIPATGKHIVHLHHFLHFMPFHLELAEHRLRLLRAAVERLLARNPHVFVVYQSAHSAYDHSPKNKHKLTAFLIDLQRTVMAGLGPRVMFANVFPITVANMNSQGHPKISDQFLSLYMGHICGRK